MVRIVHQEFMRPFTLRRTKSMKGEDGKPLIELPPRIFKLEEVPFDNTDHKAFYDALQGRYETVGNMYLNNAEYKDVGYVCSLLLLLRLRQACLHPDLILNYVNGADTVDKMRGSRCCRICLMDIETEGCWCKYCENEIVPKAKPLQPPKFNPDERPSAAKINKMLDLIRETLERSQGTDKIIIYSQFTSYLNILQKYIEKAGWEFDRYDGSMKEGEKEAMLKRFNEDPCVQIALFSLKAGSVGATCDLYALENKAKSSYN
ncbi:hypothetical protein FRC00_005086 [Tulasnella sp. 408]|nr:hypothetical protein FRC00_005086 [Tulasnella sp. 408]